MEDGLAGLNGEHSGVDGSPAWRMTEFVLNWCVLPSCSYSLVHVFIRYSLSLMAREEHLQSHPQHEANQRQGASVDEPLEVRFKLNDELKARIVKAEV